MKQGLKISMNTRLQKRAYFHLNSFWQVSTTISELQIDKNEHYNRPIA